MISQNVKGYAAIESALKWADESNMTEIVLLRDEVRRPREDVAQLLGYENYAEQVADLGEEG